MAGGPPRRGRLDDPVRLRALENTGLLDRGDDPRFDRLARLASRLLDVPVALVTLVEADREVLRGQVGLEEHGETPLSHSFCQQVVLSGEPLVVSDAREHALVRDDPAIDDLGVVAYAGVPVEDLAGRILGAVCAIDDKPREWPDADLEILRELAAEASAQLRVRGALQVAAAAKAREETVFVSAPIGMGIQSLDGRWLRANPALCQLVGRRESELQALGATELTLPADRERDAREFGRLMRGDGTSVRLESRYRHADGRTVCVDQGVSIVHDHAGAPRHFLVQANDVTERRRTEEALRMSEERFRLAMRHAPGGMAIVAPASGALLQVNRALCELLGHDERQLVTRRLDELVHPDDLARDAELDRAFAEGRRDGVRNERRLLHADGSVREVLFDAALIRGSAGEPLYGVLQTEDLTERHRLRAERERFFEVAMDMLVVSDAQGVIIDLSRAWEQTVGWTPAEMVGRQWTEFLHPDDLPRSRAEPSRLLHEAATRSDFEARFRCRDGSYRWLRWSASSDPGRGRIYGVAKDVTERRAHEAELVHLAAHDPLTGLLNRRAFAAELDAHLLRAQRYERGGALLVLDLDDLKAVNDGLGHRAGDELIAGIAHVLRTVVRGSDVLARLGGDEFAALLPEGGVAEAAEVAGKLVTAVAGYAPALAGRARSGVTASVGLAVVGREEQPAEDLLAKADLAMYSAKERGGNRWVAHTAGPARRRSSPTWVDRIQRALDEDGFRLYAQPIVDLGSGAVTQHELLLRMTAETGEPIPPGTFLPAAERFGLVGEIDRWVLGQAIDLIAIGRDYGRASTFEVNVSGRSLGEPQLLDTVERRLAETGIDPGLLVLEVSEAAALADIETARRFGERAADLGCRLALDDFGAGFGSFHYFEHLPFHFLKIDGDYITSCRTSRTDRLVVDAIVSWARELGRRTIAEFTPDAPTLELLRTLGVDFAQGHFLGMPAPLGPAFRAPAP